MAKKRKKNIIDTLEKERTILADERTLLSYIRTALSIFIFAIFLIKFFPEFPNIFLLFLAVNGLGVVLLLIGFAQFFFYRRQADEE